MTTTSTRSGSFASLCTGSTRGAIVGPSYGVGKQKAAQPTLQVPFEQRLADDPQHCRRHLSGIEEGVWRRAPELKAVAFVENGFLVSHLEKKCPLEHEPCLLAGIDERLI